MKVKAAGEKRFQEWTDRGGREGANRDREKGEERGGGKNRLLVKLGRKWWQYSYAAGR